MKIILLQDIAGIGKKWEVKEIKGGFARNYLLARNLAVLATPKAQKDAELKRKQKAQGKAVQEDLLLKSLASLHGAVLEIERKANEKGHLFDGLDVKEIGEIIKEKLNVEIPLDLVRLEKSIKETGRHKITVVHKDKETFFEIEIKPDQR